MKTNIQNFKSNKPVQRTYHVEGTLLYIQKMLNLFILTKLQYFANFYYHAQFIYDKTKTERVKHVCQGQL